MHTHPQQDLAVGDLISRLFFLGVQVVEEIMGSGLPTLRIARDPRL